MYTADARCGLCLASCFYARATAGPLSSIRRGALDVRALRGLNRLAVARGLLVLQVDLDGRVARPYQPDLRRTCDPCDHHRVLQLHAIGAIPASAAHPRRHDGGRRLHTSPVRHRVRGRGPCHSYARHGERRARARRARLRRRVRAALGSVRRVRALHRYSVRLSCGEFISRLRWLAKVFVLDGAGSADWGGRGCACFVEKQKRTHVVRGFCRVRRACGRREARLSLWRELRQSSARVTHTHDTKGTQTQTQTHTALPSAGPGTESGGGGPRSQPLRCKGWC